MARTSTISTPATSPCGGHPDAATRRLNPGQAEMTVVSLIFISPEGQEMTVSAKVGQSVMRAAVEHGIDAVRAECGGQCACATCHCYVREPGLSKLPPMSAQEADLIDFAWEPRPNSRLACQLQVTPELQGLVIELPAQQL